MKCKNCDNSFNGFFCNNCGQNSRVNKITLPNFIDELSDSIFQINRGLFFTIKELFTRPGHSIREFIIGKRKKHFKPIAYTLTLSTVYFILSQIINKKTFSSEVISGFLDAGKENLDKFDTLTSALNWLVNNPAYTAIILIPIYALASYIPFKGKKYNYLEHIVLNSYIVGQQALIYSIFLLPSIFISDDYYLGIIALVLPIAYAFWTFRTFFIELGPIEATLRSVLVYVLIYAFIIGLLIAYPIGSLIFLKLL